MSDANKIRLIGLLLSLVVWAGVYRCTREVMQ
jgi:hypothetical protein